MSELLLPPELEPSPGRGARARVFREESEIREKTGKNSLVAPQAL